MDSHTADSSRAYAPVVRRGPRLQSPYPYEGACGTPSSILVTGRGLDDEPAYLSLSETASIYPANSALIWQLSLAVYLRALTLAVITPPLSPLQEGEQICVDDISIRGAHAIGLPRFCPNQYARRSTLTCSLCGLFMRQCSCTRTSVLKS